MTASATLARLRALGVTVRADAGVLRLRPASAVPPDLLAEVRAYKADVLALLAANDALTMPAPAAPERPASASLAALQAACADRAAALAGAYDAPDVLADREAIAAEELLPGLGTAERERHDCQQGTVVRGLLLGWQTHAPAAAPAAPGRCPICGGHKWQWQANVRRRATGWRCVACL